MSAGTKDPASGRTAPVRLNYLCSRRLLFESSLRGDALALAESIDLRVQAIQQTGRRCRMGRVCGKGHRQTRAQDPCVDAMEAQRDAAPFAGDALAECAPGDAPLEQQLHELGPPVVEVLADDLLEELAPLKGAVEDLRERHPGLQDRRLLQVTGLPVREREGVRQPRQPLAQQGLDALRRDLVADSLRGRGVCAAAEAVVERIEPDPAPEQLALDALVAVQAQARSEREEGAEIE